MARLNWPKSKGYIAGLASIRQGYADDARIRRSGTSHLKVAWEAMAEARRQLGIKDRILGAGHTDYREERYLIALDAFNAAEAVFVLLKEARRDRDRD